MGGYSWAQTLTKVTSLDDINETDSYVLEYNGAATGYPTPCFLYVNGTSIASTTNEPDGRNSYYFNLEKVSDGIYKIKSVLTSTYLSNNLSNNQVILGGSDNLTWNFEKYSSNNKFIVYFVNLSGYRRYIIGNGSIVGTASGGKSTTTPTASSYTINIYKVQLQETVNVTIKYYNEDGTPIVSKGLTPNKGDKTLSDLLETFPTYIDAKCYHVEDGTETSVTDTEKNKTKISADAIYKVVTSYNANFTFPQTSNEYFALKMGDYYLGRNFGIKSPNNDNKYSIATRIDGDWYNGFSIVGYDGYKLYYDGTYINWSNTEDYKWKISNDMKFTIQDGTKYLAVYETNCLAKESYAAELASTDAATAILENVVPAEPEYVGQLPYNISGLSFDKIVKGVDFTNGTCYFIEKATDDNTVLSSSDAITSYGNTATSANFTTNTSKGFNELWQYQDGYFVHANSGLKLTADELLPAGPTWTKEPTGTALVYKLNKGTADYFTVGGNDTWKFRLAKSVTLNLTEKNGKSYATTCAPVPVKLSDSDAGNTTLYIEKSHTENKISFGKAEAVAANTGIFIENTNGDASVTLLFAKTGDESEATSPILAGTTVKLSLSGDREDYRTLGFNAGGEIGFFKPASSIAAIPANRAFLYLNGISLTNAFYIDFDGTTTSIDELLPAADVLGGNAPVYDLSGRRMQGTLHKGIYIQNGRKFMVK